MNTQELDFKLVEDLVENKIFIITNLSGSIYDMTGSTVICKLYLTSTPTDIACSVNLGTGEVTVPFTATHSDNPGTFEYILQETTSGGDIIPLLKGNIIIVPYVPFSETIEAYLRSELPANITLTMDYRNQRITYWRRILQEAFNIADADLNIEAAWPILVNALLAKLVVYDAMMLGARGSFLGFIGGDFTTATTIGAPVKKIETGPTNVEYHSTSKSIQELFQPNAQGYSAFTTMIEELCGLANYLKVKIPMCKGNDLVITPTVSRNPDWEFITLDDIDNDIETPPSQG